MKILLAVDASEFSEAAIQAVLAQFSPKTTEVQVFHAVDWEEHLPPPYLFAQGREQEDVAHAPGDPDRDPDSTFDGHRSARHVEERSIPVHHARCRARCRCRVPCRGPRATAPGPGPGSGPGSGCSSKP